MKIQDALDLHLKEEASRIIGQSLGGFEPGPVVLQHGNDIRTFYPSAHVAGTQDVGHTTRFDDVGLYHVEQRGAVERQGFIGNAKISACEQRHTSKEVVDQVDIVIR